MCMPGGPLDLLPQADLEGQAGAHANKLKHPHGHREDVAVAGR